nr:ribonuclease P protein component [Sulfurihydrogenibium sp.]
MQNVFSKKQIVDNEDFLVVYLKNDQEKSRYAFVTSKKNFKKSVDRNRAKRLLREAVRLRLNLLDDLKYDMIFIAKKSILNKKVYDILSQIDAVIGKLKNND